MDAAQVGRAIAFLRKEKGYTQSYLANLIGVSDKAVSKWERGMGTPDISLLTKLSIILDIDIEALLEGNLTRYDQRWKGVICSNDWKIPLQTPIYDKPLFDYICSYFLLAGITSLKLFSDEKNKLFVESRIDYYSQAGLEIVLADKRQFSSDSLVDYAEHGNLMLLYSPLVLYGMDLTKYLQRAMSFNRSVTSIVIKSGTENHLQLPLSFLSGHFLEITKQKGEDFSLILKRIASEGRSNPITIGRGMIALPVKTWEDVLRSSAFIRTVQEAMKLRIADLDEIARYRNISGPDALPSD